MASNSKRKVKESPGTVLLCQAEPKYNFVGKKLPKQPDEIIPAENRERRIVSDGQSSLSKDINLTSPKSNFTVADSSSVSKMLPSQNRPMTVNASTTQGKKPVAIVGASLKSKSSSFHQANPSHNSINVGSAERNLSLNPQSPTSQSLTTNPASESNNLNSFTVGESSLAPTALSTTVIQNLNLSTSFQSDHGEEQAEEEENAPLIDTSAAAAALSGVTHGMLSKRLVEVESERNKLKKELDAQLQVNSELKRLLVASVGDDLGKRVERLAQDRVQLSMDIGGFSKKMTEDYENLDKMSIQADMWRSKYLASRVMVEELGNARAYFSLQWHESQEALQQMLNERHELRTNLLEAYKILQQVKDAFDPLNSHRSSTLTSTNVLDLSRACQQLVEAVRFRLLPAHVATASSVEIDLDTWADSVTRAEQYAHELLSRPSEPSGSLQSGSSSVLPMTRSPPLSPHQQHHGHHPHINRFHPLVKHENVTYHCCKCKGEIRVV